MTGWIKIHRKIINKGYYQNSQYVHLWVHLLLKANHEEKEWLFKGKLHKAERGQMLTSRITLSKETGIPQTTIERILKTFENEHQIGQQINTKNRLITILNYEQYQKADTKMDNKRTTSGQQADTNKNYKELKNDKEIILHTEQSSEDIKNILNVFVKTINPTLNWGNKTYRKSAESIIKHFGPEKAMKITEYAVKIQGRKYSPTITNPYQLKEKIGELMIYAQKQKEQLPTIAKIK